MFNPKSKLVRAACVAGLSLSLVGGVCAPAVQAFAADSDHAVTVTSAQTHTYKLIKLFSGSFTTDADGKLHMGDAKVSDETVAKVLRNTLNTYAHDPKWETATDQQLADGIAALSEEDMQAFANSLAAGNVDEANYTPLAASDGAYVVGTASGSSGTATLTAPSDGYYLLVSDPSTVWGQVGESGTQAVLTPIAGDTTVATKTSVPTVTKMVAGEGRDAEGNRIWSEIADRNLVPGYPAGSHALRDIAFKIDVALPDTVTAVGESGSYPLSIVDTLPEGFTYSQEDGTDITAGGWFTVTVSDGKNSVQLTPDLGGLSASVSEDGKTLTWTISDLMALKGTVDIDGAVVTVIYDDEALNSKGVVDDVFSQTTSLASPFVNHAYATYKPFAYGVTGDEANKTVEDQAKLYSYNLRVNKVGDAAEALKGAAFTLTDADGTVIGKNITAADDGTFCFTGLDSVVEYTLTETQVPSGHKAIDPIKFKIAATVSTEGDEVTAISATETADPSNAATFTVDDATVVATVVNLSGPQMPVTGAAGIAGGIVVGGALIAVSAASLRKKRASE